MMKATLVYCDTGIKEKGLISSSFPLLFLSLFYRLLFCFCCSFPPIITPNRNEHGVSCSRVWARARVYVCVCVCAWERERERERESLFVVVVVAAAAAAAIVADCMRTCALLLSYIAYVWKVWLVVQEVVWIPVYLVCNLIKGRWHKRWLVYGNKVLSFRAK